MELLTNNAVVVLTNSIKEDGKVNIPNDHAFMTQFASEVLIAASAIGVDLAKAEYTYTVKRDGIDIAIYKPRILRSADGQVVLEWGMVRLPMSKWRITPTFLGTEDGAWLSFAITSEDELDIPLVLAVNEQGKTPDMKTLRTASKSEKTLAPYLSEGFQPALSLSTLTPGEYTVSDYRMNRFGKFEIKVEGYGWFKANTSLEYRLLDEPMISSEQPAKLSVGESTKKAKTGHPIVPTSLELATDANLPVFRF